jgi:hypothetical protein
MSKGVDFKNYLDRFEAVVLPFTIDESNYRVLNERNEPLPDIVASMFMTRLGEDEDVAEYVPFFRLEDHDEILVLVLWRAGLLRYDYLICTYDKNGGIIDQAIIASNIYTSESTTKSVARFEEDGLIYSVSATTSNDNPNNYDMSMSKSSIFEVLPDGQIQQTKNNV